MLRILEYVRTHLAECDLTPARIARAHSISVRQLYAVLARADIGLGDWIRTQRLEQCRNRAGVDLRWAVEHSAGPGAGDAQHLLRHRDRLCDRWCRSEIGWKLFLSEDTINTHARTVALRMRNSLVA